MESLDKVLQSSKFLHGRALGFVAFSVALLMAQEAYRRIVNSGGEAALQFLRTGSRFVISAWTRGRYVRRHRKAYLRAAGRGGSCSICTSRACWALVRLSAGHAAASRMMTATMSIASEK